MYKLKKVIPFIMLLYFIIKANECYGMKISENNVKKTGMEKIKALPHSTKIFIYGNKFFFSLAHSIINNFYELETLEMNKLYSLKKYLCWGYRLQPSFMTPYSFIDFNVNILGGIMDSVMFLILSRSKGHINITTKGFYIFTSPFNINLNLKITKDFYIAINLTGILRTVALLFLIRNKNINEEKGKENIFIENNNLNNNLNEDINNNQKDNLNNVNLNNKQENNVNNANLNNNQDNIPNDANLNNNPKGGDDEWEKIRKGEGITDEQNQKLEEMYNELEKDFYISLFLNEIEIKKEIFKQNFNREKIIHYIEEKM